MRQGRAEMAAQLPISSPNPMFGGCNMCKGRGQLALIVAMLAMNSVSAAHPKIARDLNGAGNGANVDVIVQFKQVPSDKQHKKVKDKGGSQKADLPLVKGALY